MIKIEIDGVVHECDRFEFRAPRNGGPFITDEGKIQVSTADWSETMYNKRICLVTDPKPEPSEWERFRDGCSVIFPKKKTCLIMYNGHMGHHCNCREADCPIWRLRGFVR